MSCGAGVPTFRLLDPRVGWDVAEANELVGFDSDAGISLAALEPGAIRAEDLAPYLPPPWIAPGCAPCEWFLLAPPDRAGSRLLALDRCTCTWRDHWPADCTPLAGADLVAIAAAGPLVALADRAAGRVIIASSGGPAVIANFAARAEALAFDCCGGLLVAVPGETRLERFDLAGAKLTPFSATLPAAARRVMTAADGAVWVATDRAAKGRLLLWRAMPGDAKFIPAALADLTAIQTASGLVTAADNVVCLTRSDAQGEPVTYCWSRFGSAVPPPAAQPPLPAYQRKGQLLTLPIDSGIPRCEWHRVQLDADIPDGTALSVAVATAESAFAGFPHPLDWREVAGAQDLLIQQPPGRYLYLRLRLQSADGVKTPVVRRIRLDFPRATSLDFLPAIYRADADAAEFTARFLGLFDASIADLDSEIERAPALLDAGGVPDAVLPWLGSFLGLVFDPGWDTTRRRSVLQALPELYRLRGTLAGLKLAFQKAYDLDPAVMELGPTRPWAALGKSSLLGSARLFGRNRSRARIGSSALGQTRLKSWGDPARDPLDALAWRVEIMLPPSATNPPPARVQALLDSQKPAHVLATVRLGGEMFLAGISAAIGIDTAFLPPPAPVLGQAGNVRLGRSSVLRRGRRASGHHASFVVGQALSE